MNLILTKADGRLRTGLIALVIFLLLLIIPGIVIRVNESAEPVLVKVKHRFIAATESTETIQTRKTATIATPEIVEQQSQQVTETIPHPTSEPAPERDPEPRSEKNKKPEPSDDPSIQHALESAEPVKFSRSGDRSQADISARQIVGATFQPRNKHNENPVVEVAITQPHPATVLPSDRPDPVEKSEPLSNKTLDVNLEQESVTVSSKTYWEIFQNWRAVGTEKIEGKKPALLVENLREAFDSFNMKPVVVTDEKLIDLLDGSRLPDGVLESYATTVFQVEKPWRDWGEELKTLGLKPGDKFEVRYHMYDFIHRAIYARSHQAINWAKGQGLLVADQQAEDLQVRGRAFLVKQQGGGRFGVFVPRQVLSASGRRIEVAPSAFAGQPDVAQLRQAGVL